MRGVYVDTGLMREGETDFVRAHAGTSRWSTPRSSSSTALAGVTDPEQKRHIIGEEFVRVQERIIESRRLLDEHWILGQGTIYPDTIESGGTAKAALIKTHHNRVAGNSEADRSRPHRRAAEIVLQGRSSRGRPRTRAGRQNCWTVIRSRAPASPSAACARSSTRRCARHAEGFIVPVNSVGVQGDSRTYAPVLAIDALDHARATELINAISGVNRVIAPVETRVPVETMQVRACSLTAERLGRLRSGGCNRAPPHARNAVTTTKSGSFP